MKNRIDKNLLLCIAISLLTASAALGGFIFEGGGAFTVRDDFNAQQIPFTVALKDALLDGGISGWNWNVDLGGSTLQSFSFYELGSVFFWITMLFPASAIPYLTGFIYILKYTVAAVSAYYYLRLFAKDRTLTAVFALLYAFSGFQATNLLFYHFHDAVAFFPLLLLGLENYTSKRDKRSFALFALSVFVNCFTNYFFFIQEVIFILIYFCVRFLFTSDRRRFKELCTLSAGCALGGALGVAMASVLFLPSVIYILQGERAGERMGLASLFYDTRGTLFILKGILFPGDTMNSHSLLIHENWQSASCFIPLFGISGGLAYCSRKDYAKQAGAWLKRLLIILTLLSFSPLLSSGFILFTETTLRWWYMPVLMLVLATEQVWEAEAGRGRVQAGIEGSADDQLCSEDGCRSSGKASGQYHIGRWSLVSLGLIAVYTLLLTKMEWSPWEDVVYNRPRFMIYAAFSAAGAVLVFIFTRIARRGAPADSHPEHSDSRPENPDSHPERTVCHPERQRRILSVDYLPLILAVAAFCAASTFMTLHFYRSDATETSVYMKEYRRGLALRQGDDPHPQYRLNVDNDNIDTMVARKAGLASFISTRCNGISEFESLFEYYSTNNGLDKTDITGLPELLGGQYELSYEKKDSEAVAEYGSGEDKVYIYEGDKSCPIGFALDRCIYKSDLMNIDRNKRAIALTQAAVVEDGFADDPSLPRVLPGEMNLEADRDYLVNCAIEASVTDFHRDGKGFVCRCSYDRDRYIYFSVPYDPGWDAYVDGLKTGIIDSGGMMLLPVKAGDHSIEFRYRTPFFPHGLCLSIAGWLIAAALFIAGRPKRTPEAATQKQRY